MWSQGTDRNRRRLTLESLEGRDVPAGAVTATLAGGTLTLVGDQRSNEISITQNVFGDVVVTGAPGTTVTGASVAAGVNDIVVQMNQGDDVVELANLFILGELNIDTGNGSDRVTLGGNSVFSDGDMTILTGNGDDTVELISAFQAGVTGLASTLTIDTGNGADSVTLAAAGGSGSNGSVDIQTGNGSDTVTLGGAFITAFSGTMSIGLGNGSDTLDASGLGSPLFSLGTITVDGGAGADTLIDPNGFVLGAINF